MKRVDKMLLRVRRASSRSDKQLSLGFITYVTDGAHAGQWEAIAELWDGSQGGMNPEDRIYSYHATKEEALAALKEVERIHAPKGLCDPLVQDVPIFIDDIGAAAPNE